MNKTYVVELPQIPDVDTDRMLKELEQFYTAHNISQEEKDFLYQVHKAICVFQLVTDGKLTR